MEHQEIEELHNAYISGDHDQFNSAFMKSPTRLIKFYSGIYHEDKSYSLDVLRKT